MTDLRVFDSRPSALINPLSDEKIRIAVAIAEEITALGLTGRRVIADLGCGDGRLLGGVLEKLGAGWDPRGRIHCVDGDPRLLGALALSFSSRPYRLELHPCSLSEFLDRNGDFLDVAIASHSLIGEKDLRGTLEKLAAASGTLFLTADDGEGFASLRYEFETSLRSRGFHLHTGQAIANTLRDFGLRVRVKPLSMFVPVPTGPDFSDFAAFVLAQPRHQLAEADLRKLRELVGSRAEIENRYLLITCSIQAS